MFNMENQLTLKLVFGPETAFDITVLRGEEGGVLHNNIKYNA
jgi:hypothetical protein